MLTAGLCVMSGSWLQWLACGIAALVFYAIQIPIEEANLIQFVDGYKVYFRKKSRLMPGVY